MISPLSRRVILSGGKGASQLTNFAQVTSASNSQRAILSTNGQLKQTRRMATAHSGLIEIGHKHVTKGVGRIVDGVAVKGEGSYVQFEDGRRLLDFTCGIGVTNLGHCHPKVTQAAAQQCQNIVHAQCGVSFHAPYLHLIEKLIPIMPDPSLNSFFLWNSGSEAVECSIKMARIITGRQNVIAMQGGYHGRTFGAMALTSSKTIYSEGNAPLMPGVFNIPYPYWHQHGLPQTTSEKELVDRSLYQLDLRLKQQTTPQETAAIIIEPVLGEGGYVPAPHAFLRGLRDVCDKHGILLIVDEVQSGFGRTGKMFNIEYSGVKPDIMLCAKGLANGYPLSLVVSRKELTDKLKPGTLGGTYAGNAVSCAASVAVIDAFKHEHVLKNVRERSKELFAYLNSLRENSTVAPYILDVRGQGLMVAIEFASPSGSAFDPFIKSSAPTNLSSRVAKRCVEKGMMILTTSVYEVIRFIPPLNISGPDLKKGFDIFAKSFEEVVREG